MYYPDHLIEEIRVQNNIVDVISDYVQLTKKGGNHFGLCPFHNEKSPSFSVSEDKQMYYCFGCGAGGNVYTFIQEYENYNFVEAVKHLAERVHIELPEAEVSEELKRELSYKQQLLDANKETARYFYYQMMKDTKHKALKYLESRGIDEEIRKRFGLGYSRLFRDDLLQYLRGKGFKDQVLLDAGLIIRNKNKPDDYYDRFFDRLMFPIFDVHNRVIAFGGRILGDGEPKYLNSPETKLFDKSRNLYGLNIARTSRKKKIILVEGYMDVISLHQAGFYNTVASLGTAFTTGHASLLRKYVDDVVIAYDADDAGIKATLRAIPTLKKVGLGVRVLTVQGAKDPDEFIKSYGNEAFEGLIEHAEPSFMYEIRQLENTYDLKDPDDRTKFDTAICEKLLTLENEMERENYLEAVIDKYRLKRNIIENELARLGKGGIVTNSSFEPEPVAHRESKDVLMRAQKNLLTFMTSHYKVFGAVKPYLAAKEFTDPVYRQVAEYLYKAYEMGVELEPANLVMKFDGIEEQNQIAGIFNNNMPVEHSGQLEKMITENVRIIKRHYIEQLSRQVSDPVHLQEMIVMKKQLDSMDIQLD